MKLKFIIMFITTFVLSICLYLYLIKGSIYVGDMQVFMAKERVVEMPYKFCSITADLFCAKKPHYTLMALMV